MFDFVFLDADKTGYPDYYEQILPRMKPNALLLIDNILMGGDVVDPEPGSVARGRRGAQREDRAGRPRGRRVRDGRGRDRVRPQALSGELFGLRPNNSPLEPWGASAEAPFRQR